MSRESRIDQGDPAWHLFRKTPLFELLTSAVIITVHTLAGPRLRIASDALFLEGVALSVIGSLAACRTEHPASHSLERAADETSAHQQPSIRQASLGSLLKQKNGYRILLIGLVLVGAAVVIGELFVRRAG